MLKNVAQFTAAKKMQAAALAASLVAVLGTSVAQAQITTADVITSLETAGDSGITVGQAVIGIIASFVVVGVIIGMVRKLG